MSYGTINPVNTAVDDGVTHNTASILGQSGQRHKCTYISGYTDAASVIQIISGASTVIWHTKLGAAGNFHFPFPEKGGPVAASGSAIKVLIVSGTAGSYCSIGAELIR